jgi:pimeloyl-ACP methyl ester carboxylesterase
MMMPCWKWCLRLTNSPALPLLLLVALFLPGCATSKPTLVVLVGGAGLSQLGDLGENISALCPDADVIETGGWDGFRADLRQIIRAHPSAGLVLVGHSFGCRTIADAAADLPAVDLAVMIDPAWDDITLPPTVYSCLWYQRADEGLERRAVITNGGRPELVSGDHNDICHSPQLIAEVSQAVRNISARHAMQQRLRDLR